METLFRRFLRDSSGATAIEYALIMAVCLVPMAALGAGGEALVGLIDHAAVEIAAAGPQSSLTLLPAPDLPGGNPLPD